VLLLASCEEAPPAAVPAGADQTRCDEQVAALADDLQRFIDGFAGMSALEYATDAEAVDGTDLQATIEQRQRRLLELDCDPDETRERLESELERVRGEGVIANAIADGLRAEVLGIPGRSSESIAVSPEDDLAAIALTAAPGSTLELSAGDHHVDEPVLVVQSLRIVGAGTDETRIVSTADETAISVLESGGLELADVSVHHEADATSAVLLVLSPRHALRDTRITGARAGEDGSGGIGVLLMATPRLGPTRGGAEDDLDGRLERVEVSGSEGPGLVVQGTSTPTIVDARLSDNGICGICYLGNAGGTLADSEVTGNEVGVFVAGSASPEVVGTTIATNTTDGILVEGRARGSFRDNEVVENGERGVTITADAAPGLSGNRIADNGEVGVAVSGSSRAVLEGNEITGHEVGVWIEGTASATVEGNELTGEDGVGLAVVGTARATATGNRIVRYSLGIELREGAWAELRDNVVEGSLEAAIVLRDESEAVGGGNRCEDVPLAAVTFDSSVLDLDGAGCPHQDG
jgi:parallel beta-helix repeat protein